MCHFQFVKRDDGSKQICFDASLTTQRPVYHVSLACFGTSKQMHRIWVTRHVSGFVVGQEFAEIEDCRRSVKATAIQDNFELKVCKSDKQRFTVICAGVECLWRLHAAKVPDSTIFTVRSIREPHSCGGPNTLGHKQASSKWISYQIRDRVKDYPEYKPKEIATDLRREHGVSISYSQAWRSKERSIADIRGSVENAYHRLPAYCHQIIQSNPGSVAQFETDERKRFQRIFVSYYAYIRGFMSGCRPLLGLDGTHLKGKYLGILLCATGIDADGALFPLASGIVDAENHENLLWFLSQLRELWDLTLKTLCELTILSDRQKGLIEAVRTQFPGASHGFCMRHLSENFRKESKNPSLISLLWKAAYAQTQTKFEQVIFEIELISVDAAQWVLRCSPSLWASFCFEGKRYGHLTSNIVESFNSWILEARELPILNLLEKIRQQLMVWFTERRRRGSQMQSILTPSVDSKVAVAINKARRHQVLRANDVEFEVITDCITCAVNISISKCSCKSWQQSGIPCSHAVAALLTDGKNVRDYTCQYLSVSNYQVAYNETIHPIEDQSF
jgi:MuDR family transposase/MULE transposase domain/SWIM zinc finger